MAIKEPQAPVVGDKGLQAGALGLVGNVVIGLAAVAPAYSLAATLGYVVLAVGDKAPSMFVLAFIPMLLVAFAYKELSQDTPDCGTTFTWSTKAFGPWIGWIGGWGLAVSAIIVLANVAESRRDLPVLFPRTGRPGREHPGQGAARILLHHRHDAAVARAASWSPSGYRTC